MPKKCGQTTIEYLIILAVIIVIALIVVGVLGGFPSFGTSISEQQSKLYWRSTSPLGLTDWRVDPPSTMQLAVKNNSSENITLVEIDVKRSGEEWTSLLISSYNSDLNVYAGDQAAITSDEIDCTGGTPYSFDVRFLYSVSGGLSESIQTGQKPIVGTCVS